MKYIESKPNGDGTFDHTEVRAAYENGCKVEFNFPGWLGEDWFCVDKDERCGRSPIWNDYMIYRASVPDTYGIHRSSSTLREGGPAVAEMLLDRISEVEKLNREANVAMIAQINLIHEQSDRIKELENVLSSIEHSVYQALKPGNDWRRELRLIASTIEVNKEQK